jgi:predicted TIM-barrel enzyme
MPAITSRSEVLTHLRQQTLGGRPIIGGGAGTGLSAKAIEAGDGDLIFIYNSGKYRMAGRGSLAGLMPYGDANQVVVDLSREILPIIKHTGVVAGVCASDPFRIMKNFLQQLKELGFCGVQNFPTVGLIDGNFRQNLEETGMGYDKEVEMIQKAHDLGLLTAPYVFNIDQAELMARAGADIIVVHVGLTISGSVGALTAKKLELCVTFIQDICEAVHAINPEIILMCHGGPIAGRAQKPCLRSGENMADYADRT